MGRYGGYIGPSPTTQKRLFSSSSQSPFSGWNPGRDVGPSCLPLNQDSVSRSLLTNVFLPNPTLSHSALPLQSILYCKILPTITLSARPHTRLQIMYSESYLALRHCARCRNWTCPLFWLVNPQITWPSIHLVTDLFVDHYLLTDPFVDQLTQSSHHLFQPPTVMFWPFKLYLSTSLSKRFFSKSLLSRLLGGTCDISQNFSVLIAIWKTVWPLVEL